MNKIYIQSIVAVLILSSSVRAQESEAKSQNVIQSIKDTAECIKIAAASFQDVAVSIKEKAAIALAVSAAGGIVFYEDHLMPLEDGQHPDAGNNRIIWSAQYNKTSAFEEGKLMGGSVLGAMNKCLAAKAHYEDPNLYGPGACERIKQYAPGHHFWETLRSGVKWYFFVIPVGVTTAIVASCTGVCAYKKLKRS